MLHTYIYGLPKGEIRLRVPLFSFFREIGSMGCLSPPPLAARVPTPQTGQNRLFLMGQCRYRRREKGTVDVVIKVTILTCFWPSIFGGSFL